MASNIKMSDAIREDQSDAIVALLSTGATLGGATLLGTLTIAGALGTYSAGVLTFGAITSDSAADNSGTAAWFRIATSGGTAHIDGTVGTSGADLNLNTVTIVAGGPIAITSMTLTMPGG